MSAYHIYKSTFDTSGDSKHSYTDTWFQIHKYNNNELVVKR
jgi:hypothetical protein